MPRSARRDALPDYGFFHVTVRGVARQRIVRDDFDRDALIHRLRDAARRNRWRLHAY